MLPLRFLFAGLVSASLSITTLATDASTPSWASHFDHVNLEALLADKPGSEGRLRRAQTNACSAEETAVLGCINTACAQCLDNSYSSIFDNYNSVTCRLLSIEVCDFIENGCSMCSTCTTQVRAYYQCRYEEVLECGTFDCATDQCAAQARAYGSCDSTCINCISEARQAIFAEADTVSCDVYEDGICTAMYRDCTTCDTSCTQGGQTAENLWECLSTCSPFIGCSSKGDPPTPRPTTRPTPNPTPSPTPSPTALPTKPPTEMPTESPTDTPPTQQPPTETAVDPSQDGDGGDGDGGDGEGGDNDGGDNSQNNPDRSGPNSAAQNAFNQDDDDDGNGTLMGILIAAVAAIVLVVAAMAFFFFKSRRGGTGGPKQNHGVDEMTKPPATPVGSVGVPYYNNPNAIAQPVPSTPSTPSTPMYYRDEHGNFHQMPPQSPYRPQYGGAPPPVLPALDPTEEATDRDPDVYVPVAAVQPQMTAVERMEVTRSFDL